MHLKKTLVINHNISKNLKLNGLFNFRLNWSLDGLYLI